MRFLLFPGAAHGLRKPSHQRRKMNEEIAWLNRYLFETHEVPEYVQRGDGTARPHRSPS